MNRTEYKLEWAKRARAADPEKYRSIQLAYRERTAERQREYAKLYSQRRKLRDPWFAALHKLRGRLCGITRLLVKPGVRRTAKSQKKLEWLGCSREEFMVYIQSQFHSGMDWNNYGTLWEYDHIKPVRDFDLTDLEQQRECFHWTNTRPLLKKENRPYRLNQP